MHPRLFEWGPIVIHSYGFFLAISFAIGIWLAGRRAEKRGIPSEKIADASLLIIVITILGARGLYVIAHWDQFQGRWLDIFRTWEGGLTMYGGAVPAAILAMAYLRRSGVDPWKAADAIAPSMALGLGLTRIGCFLSGCCFGTPTELPWGVTFPPDSHAGSVYPAEMLHPAQLYDSFVGFALFGLLLFLDRKPMRTGNLFLILLIVTSGSRFLLDLVRTYDRTAFPIAAVPLTLNQIATLAILLWATLRLVRGPGRMARASA
jgi:phosphatidylglycerol:prolipoprotein diacylglycerol transferase